MPATRRDLFRLTAGAAGATLLPPRAACADDPPPAAAGFRVVGYLPDYRAFDPAAARGVTDLVVFSAEPTAAGDLDLSRLRRVRWADLRAFKTRHRVRLVLCVGGWERSRHFAAVAASDPARQAFAATAVRVCLAERLDGLDLDWEHPTGRAEQEGYARLLADLRAAFAPHGLVLSVTMAAWQGLPRAGFEAADWVNVMAYDHPGRHSTFEQARADVDRLTAAGAPAAKITLGIPLYGRSPARRSDVLTYREIVAKHRPAPADDEAGGLYFNGPATVRRKTEYALGAGLAGVMVWELGQDAAGADSLVGVIRSAVARRVRKD
jgi:GH18 family chitinase